MNPRAAINDLSAFQANPFNHLGTSPDALSSMQCLFNYTERVGFEPTAPFGVTGFQDQLLKPLGHLSMKQFPANRLTHYIGCLPACQGFFCFFIPVPFLMFSGETNYISKSSSCQPFFSFFCIFFSIQPFYACFPRKVRFSSPLSFPVHAEYIPVFSSSPVNILL